RDPSGTVTEWGRVSGEWSQLTTHQTKRGGGDGNGTLALGDGRGHAAGGDLGKAGDSPNPTRTAGFQPFGRARAFCNQQSLLTGHAELATAEAIPPTRHGHVPPNRVGRPFANCDGGGHEPKGCPRSRCGGDPTAGHPRDPDPSRAQKCCPTHGSNHSRECRWDDATRGDR